MRAEPVQVAGSSGNDIVVAGGIAPGQTVVTAGVNLLKSGQKVKILGDDPALRDEPKVAAGATAAPLAPVSLSAGAGK